MLASGTSLGCGFTICVAFWGGGTEAATTYTFGEWKMVIQPGHSAKTNGEPAAPQPPVVRLTSFQTESLPVAPMPGAADAPTTTAEMPAAEIPNAVVVPHVEPAVDPLSRVELYRAVYDSIPFSRAEYDANPTYRHDATMEFLFGQMRPTVIHRNQTRVDVHHRGAISGWNRPYNRFIPDLGWAPWYRSWFGGVRW